ncbi:hypothetical protein C2S51_024473 [Perilla frutescens var. frutescens]|nr:hypothetical protein C2S51_024473 [Perilla frutescens var. frutescens]
MESLDCNTKSTVTPWSYQTNWIIAHGSLESSVAVESSDDPINEPDPDYTANNSPLILKPRGPDSGPCEIKICFKQKYEVGQIYVRSTARAYEIYYEKSPHGINEYLCTVRCGVAERDGKILQTSCVEDVAEEHGECLSGYATAETASSGGSTATGEDDWVNIKVSGAGITPAIDKIGSNGLNNIQDIYEATAQISDSDPCLSLTIRLLSLQEKGHVYVDELYVFVDPVEIDSGKETAAGSSAQSSLMAMFMPSLLQISKSGVNRAQDKYASEEVLQKGKMETSATIIDKIDSHQQLVKPEELGKDTSESAEPQQHTSAKKHVETKIANEFKPSHLETVMEQLVSRLSRVEDICLRFEEKMLKPIERIGARLQQVENQLEKLAKSSHDVGMPHCTRISAPAFSCSESNSSSFYNDELENKEFSCNNMPNLSHEANFHPGLIISAPEFSYGEGDEDDDDDLTPLKDSPLVKPKKSLSVDDALAAALNGFLFTAVNPSEYIQTPLGLPGDVNEETEYKRHDESCQIKTRESPAAENGNREPSHYAQVLTVKAPDFTAEETGCEEQLNYSQSSLDLASITESEKKDHGNEIHPITESNSVFKSTDSCDFGRNESTSEFGSASNVDSPADSSMVSRTCLHDEHLNGGSKVNMIETYFEGDTCGGPTEISNGSAPISAKDSRDTSMHQILEETNLGKLTTCGPNDQDAASEEVLEHEAETDSLVVEQSVAVGSFEDDAEHVSAFLDFEFPILEVAFTSDVHMSTKSPLDALLGGAAECDDTKEIDAVSTNGNEITDLLSTNGLLLDVEVSAADLEGAFHSPCAPSSEEMAVSLI